MRFAYALIALAILLSGCTIAQRIGPAPTAQRSTAPVILVSIDGMRPDYLGKGYTPNLDALARGGVVAKGMRPSFPTKTFPNHYTLVTGLRPDRHGIVGNTMLDPAMPGAIFYPANADAVTDRRWWDGAEPVWVTAEKRGIRTAVLFWPGSEADIGGVRPSHWLRYDDSLSPADRVATMLGWFDSAADAAPGFLALYFDQVDSAGHDFGPHAPETARAAAAVDTAIGQLRAGLAERGMASNIVVVSDHGLAETAPDRVVRVEDIAPAGTYRLIASGPYAGFDPLPGHEAALADALLRRHDHVRCRRKDELPARLHYGRHRRVPAFICLVDSGWELNPAGTDPKRGNHGWDNSDPEMMAMFLANGPDFARGRKLGVVDNVDVHPLLLKLLGLEGAPGDGSLAPFAPVLRGPSGR